MTPVAPYVGAWIETRAGIAGKGVGVSHPMWVRGLKLSFRVQQDWHPMSHPMWVRGLKLDFDFAKLTTKESHPMWVRGLKPKDNGLKLPD